MTLVARLHFTFELISPPEPGDPSGLSVQELFSGLLPESSSGWVPGEYAPDTLSPKFALSGGAPFTSTAGGDLPLVASVSGGFLNTVVCLIDAAPDVPHVSWIDYVCLRSTDLFIVPTPEAPVTAETLGAGFDRQFYFTGSNCEALYVQDVWIEFVDPSVPPEITVTPILRMTQRDDGRGISQHPRFTGNPTSQQESLRIHGSNTYV